MNTSTSDAPVLSTQKDAVCIITLNRPESLNAMNEALLIALKEAKSDYLVSNLAGVR